MAVTDDECPICAKHRDEGPLVGRGVPHFHQHVFARHRGTPSEVGWTDGDERPGAPRGGRVELDRLAVGLAAFFGEAAL